MLVRSVIIIGLSSEDTYITYHTLTTGKSPKILSTKSTSPKKLADIIRKLKPKISKEDPTKALVDAIKKNAKNPSVFPAKTPSFVTAIIPQDPKKPATFNPSLKVRTRLKLFYFNLRKIILHDKMVSVTRNYV